VLTAQNICYGSWCSLGPMYIAISLACHQLYLLGVSQLPNHYPCYVTHPLFINDKLLWYYKSVEKSLKNQKIYHNIRLLYILTCIYTWECPQNIIQLVLILAPMYWAFKRKSAWAENNIDLDRLYTIKRAIS